MAYRCNLAGAYPAGSLRARALLAAGLVAAGPVARAADVAATQGAGEAVHAALLALDSPSFERRQQATLTIWNAGPAVLPLLRAEAGKGSAERQARLAELIGNLALGITPHTPADVAALVRAYLTAKPDARRALAYQLLEMGHRADAIVERLAAQDASPDMRTFLLDGLAARVGIRAQGAILEGDVAGAEALLARAYTTGYEDAARDEIALALQTGTLQQEMALLAKSEPGEAVDTAQHRKLAWAYGAWAAGDAAGAIAAARPIDPEVAIGWEGASGQWLAAAQDRRALRGRGGREHPNLAAFLPLVYESLAGAAPKDLSAQLGHGAAAPDRARVLLAAGDYAAAVALLEKESPSDAFDLLSAMGHFSAALAFADKPGNGALGPAAVRLRMALGQRALATTIVTRDWVVGGRPKVDDSWRLKGLQAIGKSDDAAALAADMLRRGGLTRDSMIELLCPNRFDEASFWYQVWQSSAHTVGPTMALTADTLAGKVPAARLRRQLALAEQMAVEEGGPIGPSQGSRAASLAAGLLDNHLDAEAFEVLQRLPTNAESFDVVMRAADRAREQHDWKMAIMLYDVALAPDPVDPNPLVREADCLTRLGKAAAGAALQRTALLIPLAEDDRRTDLLTALGALGRADLMQQQMDVLLATEAPESARLGPWLKWRLENPVKGETTAARLLLAQRMAVSNLMGGLDDMMTARRWCDALTAETLLEQGDVAGAKAAATRVCEAGQSNKPVADMIRVFTAGGHGDVGEALYHQRIAAQEKLLETYPDAAELQGDVAWLMLTHGADLAAATRHAQRAADLAPTDGRGDYLLARAAVARGDRKAALPLAQKAAAKDPGDSEINRLLRTLE